MQIENEKNLEISRRKLVEHNLNSSENEQLQVKVNTLLEVIYFFFYDLCLFKKEN
jgi:hypothetical protein